MQAEYPNEREPTREEAAELAHLRGIIEKVLEDGVLSRIEWEMIQYTVFQRGITTPEQLRRKIFLYQQITFSRVRSGEVIVESPEAVR
ncbi:hypothetical protein V0288_03185 [Pannus brasiliensis CCIBt3594]|uniref:Uncharacterized protein n=1 Tax=Pannus brasiliensis CCIBt3594 TaxID=1427578 RepID=A0AAW9QR79_9CHRO